MTKIAETYLVRFEELWSHVHEEEEDFVRNMIFSLEGVDRIIRQSDGVVIYEKKPPVKTIDL